MMAQMILDALSSACSSAVFVRDSRAKSSDNILRGRRRSTRGEDGVEDVERRGSDVSVDDPERSSCEEKGDASSLQDWVLEGAARSRRGDGGFERLLSVLSDLGGHVVEGTRADSSIKAEGGAGEGFRLGAERTEVALKGVEPEYCLVRDFGSESQRRSSTRRLVKSLFPMSLCSRAVQYRADVRAR